MMSGPENPRDEPARARPDDDREVSPPRPPGEFLTDDLASATARFLEEVKERIHRAAERDPRSRRPGR
jgi:hypothetical protein